jgi:hypothetical protein
MTFEEAKQNNLPGMMAIPVRATANPKTIVAQAVEWVLYKRRGVGLETFGYTRAVTTPLSFMPVK